MTQVAPPPRIRHKTFTYKTGLQWLEDRAGTISSEGKPEVRVASPPEFKGEEGTWTPEHLFVAAIDTCTMSTFLAFAQAKELDLVSYRSEAEGVLEFVNGTYRFTKVVLKPTVAVATGEAVDEAEQILWEAHDKCLISNSIDTVVEIEPRIELG